YLYLFFFFSSRRRHTRFSRDWSSDVCSSDLHPRFPARANIGFLQIVNRQFAKLRVFERGVGETLACGTGACAAVVAGRLRGLLDEKVEVRLPGGTLRIQWAGEGQPVLMTGPATRVFEGEVRI